jgi:hypothetical protein
VIVVIEGISEFERDRLPNPGQTYQELSETSVLTSVDIVRDLVDEFV